MRILQLSPQFTYPADNGGKIGIINITKQFFEQGAEVTFFTFDDGEITQESIEYLSKYCKVILYKHSTVNTIPLIIKSFLTRTPLFITKHSNNKIKAFLLNLISNEKFDLIHADHTSMAGVALLLKKETGLPVAIRLHNIEWMIWQRYTENLKSKFKKIYIKQQTELLKQAEIKMYAEADVCFSITNFDTRIAREMAPSANVVLASVGVNPIEWLPDDNIERNKNELIIATFYSWIHNVDAIRWFIYKVMPIIRESIPDIKLTLIGKNPPEWLRNCQEPGVNCLGYVDKVQPYLNKATLYIAPLFTGSGIRVKILEAMAMKLPVIATPISAEGIPATFKDGLFICDSEFEFAYVVIGLLQSPEAYIQDAEASREFVLNNFSWEKNVGIMLDEFKKLI